MKIYNMNLSLYPNSVRIYRGHLVQTCFFLLSEHSTWASEAICTNDFFPFSFIHWPTSFCVFPSSWSSQSHSKGTSLSVILLTIGKFNMLCDSYNYNRNALGKTTEISCSYWLHLLLCTATNIWPNDTMFLKIHCF